MVEAFMSTRKTPSPAKAPRVSHKPTPSAQAKAHAKRKQRARAKAEANRQAEIDRVNALPITNRRAAGIDVGKKTHWVCVGFTEDSPSDLLCEFSAHTDGLHELVAFLREHEVTTVALESSGHYWIVLYELLDSQGFEVFLVDPSYTKQIKGRPKSDRLDCQWIYRLHAVGLLAAAFRPDEQTCVLRNYLRQRANLIRYAGQHIQHMEKALEQMNLKLTVVISHLTGVTGRKIIQAILRGTRDPQKLAKLRHEKCHASEREIAQALTGSYRAEHLFALRQAYEAWQFYQGQLDRVEEQIQQQLAQMKSTRALPPLPPKPRQRGRKPNDPRFDVRTALYYVVGLDLTEIEGFDEMTALTIISELGTDLSKFATVKHFCSWLALCPQMKKTGGKVKSSRIRPGVNRVSAALRLAAFSLARSHGALGAYYRRMKSRLGAPSAIVATAHKLARIVYYALTKGMAYVRQSQEEYQQHMRLKQIESLKRKARQLGFEIHEQAQPAEPASA
jgi:transposase